jgi:uncharacterized membrane protein YkvA (DUF1232 family)
MYLACRDPRVPWHAKALAAFVVAYALSPIDLIPDFIPVFGYLDDLAIIPLGVILTRRLIPSALFEEHRAEAARRFAQGSPVSKAGAAFVVATWIVLASGALWVAVDQGWI